MKITVFTSNQARHLALVERLCAISDQCFAVMECNTVYPGRRQDFFNKSPVMERYFGHVIHAEQTLFGDVGFITPEARTMAIRMGDLNLLRQEDLAPCLDADAFVVFGASFIKGWLCDHLVERGAFNIHMGLSPYYRGSSCNFWAMYDDRPHMVGATIHRLSSGLDSGPMLFHALPRYDGGDPFLYTMRAVVVAQDALSARIVDRSIFDLPAVPQDRSAQMRYSRNAEFTDEVAQAFLDRMDRGQAVTAPAGQPVYPAGLLSPVFG
ncbi:MAG: methionyl-tRNA formyltransferase [Chromatiaceae bacterium]|nr:methionyl-tRNA formyltransferase [Chromatiaceae bacterium]MCW5586888.1 hypothetical protein [Chromatiales bacterium]HOP16208.1 methionyl-tRNA formyltransferase [Gammaproteobacteria bacterium]